MAGPILIKSRSVLSGDGTLNNALGEGHGADHIFILKKIPRFIVYSQLPNSVKLTASFSVSISMG